METSARRPRRWLRRLTKLTCYAYLVALLAAFCALRFVGDDYWLTGVAMYLPRALFGLPCVVLTPLILLAGVPRLLWTQLVAALIVLFPLMGYVVARPTASASAGPLRVMSYNVAHCPAGIEPLIGRIRGYGADLLLLQEVCHDSAALVARLREWYPEVLVHDQYLLASRYPVSGVVHSEFMRYEVKTPLGAIALYNLHPVSPRWAFYAVRGMRVRTSLRDGSFWRGGASEVPLRENFSRREEQLATIARMAARERVPQILCGDTNVVGLSPVFARHFGDYQDGHPSAGRGFGYSFPSWKPWMRLDRVLASKELRFDSFFVGCDEESDHKCVVAQIDRAALAQRAEPLTASQ